eukprot:TRINITY_DN5439_c0_g1_i2.p1 TRINITY_DN5439_c0_g1~~TRINITY_DN5439_c0_g1_i2.p1  ORF type:complete len:512 (+),score=79.96 TRINITY_DN5439_c0_g1_i2:35-1570(+)
MSSWLGKLPKRPRSEVSSRDASEAPSHDAPAAPASQRRRIDEMFWGPLMTASRIVSLRPSPSTNRIVRLRPSPSANLEIDLTDAPSGASNACANAEAHGSTNQRPGDGAVLRDERHVATPASTASVVRRPRCFPSSFVPPGRTASDASPVLEIGDSQPEHADEVVMLGGTSSTGSSSASSAPSLQAPSARGRRASVGSDLEIARLLQLEEAAEASGLAIGHMPPALWGRSSASPSGSQRHARESPMDRALSAARAQGGALAEAMHAGARSRQMSSELPSGPWIYAVLPCRQATVCHGCHQSVSRGQMHVLYRRDVSRRAHAAHAACLHLIRGLSRPGSSIDAEANQQVHYDDSVDDDTRAQVEAELVALPDSPVAPEPRERRGRAAATARGAAAGRLQSTLLQTDRDFTAEDYEMLLQLDEPSSSSRGPQHAEEESMRQSLLEILPVSTVTDTTAGAQCMVCLEPMDAGAKVKTLPCMHVFHRQCIDRWLVQPGRIPRCPIDQTKVELGDA